MVALPWDDCIEYVHVPTCAWCVYVASFCALFMHIDTCASRYLWQCIAACFCIILSSSTNLLCAVLCKLAPIDLVVAGVVRIHAVMIVGIAAAYVKRSPTRDVLYFLFSCHAHCALFRTA